MTSRGRAVEKNIEPPSTLGAPAATTKFWIIPELFVTSVPEKSKRACAPLKRLGTLVIVYGFEAARVNVIPLTSVGAETETPVVFERRSVRWPIGNSIWRPVVSCVPIARDGIEIPLGTDRVGSGWKKEHQKAANRCHDKCFHRSNLRLSMREITKRAAPTLTVWA